MDLAERLRVAEATTADRLAAELGVSTRTIRRDLATLRERGSLITGEPGPGGGLRLERDRGLSAVHLSLAEIVTLWLSARLSQAASTLPWSGAADRALAKILSSLPRTRARELRAMCRRVIVGQPPTGKMLESAGTSPPELLRLFEESFTAGVGLGFAYVDRNGQASTRRVEAHGLLVQSPIWYVLGRDGDKREPRMFRMDRISRPRLLTEIGFRPRPEVIEELLTPECVGRSLLR
jgi:predicted DNA-binding transcriptional regulator YafY